MKETNIYNDFINKYSDYAKNLYNEVSDIRDSLPKTEEHPLYNLGTMERDSDLDISPNIYLVNANEFKERLEKIDDSSLSEDDKKAKVVFDYISEKGANLSFENNSNDVLFKINDMDIKRKDFYSSVIYNHATSNTNYFARHIGDMQIITLPDNGTKIPRSAHGLPKETMDKIANTHKENPSLLPEMFLKRGLYHEATHVVMGTNDERKCDTFAMLKIMKEHPKEAELICDIYSFARSKTFYTIDNMHASRADEDIQGRKIVNGAMTYLMPNTYEKLKEIAKNPSVLDECKTDADLMKKTYELTKDHEFPAKELEEFSSIMRQETISKKDLESSKIMQKCVAQSGTKDFDEYLEINSGLKQFLEKENVKSRLNRIKNYVSNKKGNNDLPPAPYKSNQSNIDISSIKYSKSGNDNR